MGEILLHQKKISSVIPQKIVILSLFSIIQLCLLVYPESCMWCKLKSDSYFKRDLFCFQCHRWMVLLCMYCIIFVLLNAGIVLYEFSYRSFFFALWPEIFPQASDLKGQVIASCWAIRGLFPCLPFFLYHCLPTPSFSLLWFWLFANCPQVRHLFIRSSDIWNMLMLWRMRADLWKNDIRRILS